MAEKPMRQHLGGHSSVACGADQGQRWLDWGLALVRDKSRWLGAGAFVVLAMSIGQSQTPVVPAPITGSGLPAEAGTVVTAAEPPTTITAPSGNAVSPIQTSVSGEMIGFSHVDGAGTQTITLIHASKSWMAVYHVDRNGVIRLVSSRPIDADFSLQLNATSPLPEEIRTIGGVSR